MSIAIGCAAQEGTPQLPYPPASLERAVQSIFLAGRADAMAWRAKLALWLYYLLDAGHAVDPQAFMCARIVPSLFSKSVLLVHVSALLKISTVQAGTLLITAVYLPAFCACLLSACWLVPHRSTGSLCSVELLE